MEQQELAESLQRLQPRLARFFAARVPDSFVRDDLIGRVNERILTRPESQTRIEDLERFVFGVAKNVLQEHWRESKRRVQTEATLSRRPRTWFEASRRRSMRAACTHGERCSPRSEVAWSSCLNRSEAWLSAAMARSGARMPAGARRRTGYLQE